MWQSFKQGFFTHKPVAGKFCRYLFDTQYYVKNPDKTKEIDAQKAAVYYRNKEIKPDSKMNNYIQNPEIYNKLND